MHDRDSVRGEPLPTSCQRVRCVAPLCDSSSLPFCALGVAAVGRPGRIAIAMDPDSPTFLNFGAFETTAFFTAVLVACYSLISNPTGRQGPFDRSELRVYSGWRLAMLVIASYVVFLVIVLSVLVHNGTSAKAIVWVLLLMVAPWVLLAGSIRRTLSSWQRVRSMMLGRTSRKQLAAVAREYFLTGQRGIFVARIVYRASGVLPVMPVLALARVPEMDTYHDIIRRCATPTVVAQGSSGGRGVRRSTRERAAEAVVLLDMGILWSVHQGAQPWDLRGARLASWISFVDPLARMWTQELVPLAATPFPDFRRCGGDSGVSRLLPTRAQARYLDMVDELQSGGTLSDELYHRALRGRYCTRCILAVRGAVEAFLESNERGHTGMRADVWLRNFNMQWHGHYETVVDVLWEATFMEASASRLAVSEEPDLSNTFGDRSKVLTVRMMTVLFLVLRSLAGSAPQLDALSHHIAQRLHSLEYWVDFWQELRQYVSVGGRVDPSRIKTSAFKAVTRTMQDREMEAVVDLLQSHPISGALCEAPTCWLHTDTTMKVIRVGAHQGPSATAAAPAMAPTSATTAAAPSANASP